MIELVPTNAHGLALASPIMAAAGCLGYGVEYARMLDLTAFGAIVTRTTTLQPRRVSRPPRILETPAGLLSVGPWPNPGIERVLNRYAPVWAGWTTPVILSITGETTQDYSQIAGAIEGVEGIAALEIVLPDDPNRATSALAVVRRATLLPLLVKLPPLDAGPLLELAALVQSAGADALTLCAAPRGVVRDEVSGELLDGWLSGPAIGPLALRRLAEVASQIPLPIIGCGGIASAEDVSQMLAAGAQAVQIGAALLANPHAVVGIAAAL